MTAVVGLSAGGAITGFSLVPAAAADMASPTGMPVSLLALEQSVGAQTAHDAMLRSAVVNVANYYLQMARSRTPAQMEAIIWQHASLDGADHGASCAAFASLTLELGARVVGQHSWVTGGSSYPWPLHAWADARVDPNPASPGIVSIQQDAQAHHRWHPLGDGYQPQPGDWVLFDRHVEVVTQFANGLLFTIGGDSSPNFSVNAHEYPAPLAPQGVAGFVDNGAVSGSPVSTWGSEAHVSGSRVAVRSGHQPGGPTPAPRRDGHGAGTGGGGSRAVPSLVAIPGTNAASLGAPVPAQPRVPGAGYVAIPGIPAAAPARVGAGLATDGQPAAGPQAQQQVTQGQPAGAQPEHASPAHAQAAHGQAAHGQAAHGQAAPGPASQGQASQGQASQGQASQGQASQSQASQSQAAHGQAAHGQAAHGQAAHGQAATANGASARTGGTLFQSPFAAIPGLPHQPHAIFTGVGSSPGHHRHHHQSAPVPAPVSHPNTQQAFINQVAPGAIATQQRYGVPAPVTIAQAILESGWGQSGLATRDHNLFGIKGTGPAGSDQQPSVEYLNGQWVTLPASFRIYHNVAESINDHGALLATSGYYQRAMSAGGDPNAFANALTGVYATDPQYGAKLIHLMQRYNLYQYGTAAPATGHSPASFGSSPSSSTTPGAAPPHAPAWTPHRRASGPAHPARTGTQSPVPATPGAANPPATKPDVPAPGTTAPSAPRARAKVRPPRSSAATQPSLGAAAIPGLPGTAPEPLVHGQSQPPPARALPGDGEGSPTEQNLPAAQPSAQTLAAAATPASAGGQRANAAAPSAPAAVRTYRPSLPLSVKNAFTAMAKRPLAQAETLYRDVGGTVGVRWELLAACDWMQCEGRPRYSPVHGERLGTENPDGSVYHTKSAALEQCALDLAELAQAVYGIDLTPKPGLSISQLASVFAAFRWGGLLKLHHTSAMEFPYSVAGLTSQHLRMRWPNIDHPNTPDKPGGRFRMPFGAVPVVLSLSYSATA